MVESGAPNSKRALTLLSVVAPVMNEAEGVDELVTRLKESCSKAAASYELIVVNDGSRDSTLPRLIALSEATPELRVVDLFRNYGPMAALAAGTPKARGDAVGVMDGDLQDPPELIPELVDSWRSGAACVYGFRAQRQGGARRRGG